MSNDKMPPLNRTHPHTEYEEVPSYYHNDDVPHVLALIRSFDRFFDEIIEKDERFRGHYTALYDAYVTMMERELQPYAFDLAVSLIALEDQRAEENDPERRDAAGEGNA